MDQQDYDINLRDCHKSDGYLNSRDMVINGLGGGRNHAIDIMKFLAALLITNSHMGILYPEDVRFLATGGAVGNALFFFCSGFTLFKKPMTGVFDFPDWYKRRIVRIYPSVFAVAIIACLFFNTHKDIIQIIIGSGWFVNCIMLYYIIIYAIGSYCKNSIPFIAVIIAVATSIWFYFIYDIQKISIYKLEDSNICILFYFIFMLLGAKIGSLSEKTYNHIRPLVDTNDIRHLLLMFVYLGVFYFFLFLGSKERYFIFQLLSILPLILAIYYIYRACQFKFIINFYNANKVVNFVVRFVGGLCLEIYLVQQYLFTDQLNALFPLNILIIIASIIVVSYISRTLSRFLSQTIDNKPYEWKKIVNTY